jgi:dihydropteroate synthase
METNETLLELLCASENHKSSVKRVFPVGNRLLYLDRPFLMAIVNMTPDSFSDGGKYISDSTETPSFGKALQSCLDLIRDGADILDIGGQSTRPNATLISEEEEVNRVIPLIKMIREKSNIPISIDTFYSSVARKALECGADIVNDITGGTRDPEMLRVVSETGASMCIMHMRGDSKTMMGLTDYTDGVVNEVIRSLDKMITGAIGKSIPRWNLLADPGLGFAKSGDQNYDLIRNAALIEKAVRVPLLWGPSRKRFIGDVVKKDASERVFGTGAVCTSLVYSSNSALFLRVHDVKEMADIVKVAVLCKK